MDENLGNNVLVFVPLNWARCSDHEEISQLFAHYPDTQLRMI